MENLRKTHLSTLVCAVLLNACGGSDSDGIDRASQEANKSLLVNTTPSNTVPKGCEFDAATRVWIGSNCNIGNGLRPNSGIPRPTPNIPVPTPNIPVPTPNIPRPTPNIPVPTPSIPRPTPNIPAPTPNTPVPTPNVPTPPTPSNPDPAPQPTPAVVPYDKFNSSELLAALNKARATGRNCTSYGVTTYFPPAPPLSWDARLADAARAYTYDAATNMATAGIDEPGGPTSDHKTSDGLRTEDRHQAAGYFGGGGENLAFGYDTAAKAVDIWIESKAGHCNALMDGHFIHVGGSAHYRADSHFKTYWAAEFGVQ